MRVLSSSKCYQFRLHALMTYVASHQCESQGDKTKRDWKRQIERTQCRPDKLI